jgi:ATPase subunit of ABC transporter with duplicated ATPase domains
MLQKPNVLILDEPTNHLDLEAINALNVALQKFEGTVLLVTHDQDLMEEVGTAVWHFDHGQDPGLQGRLRRVRSVTGVSTPLDSPVHRAAEIAVVLGRGLVLP